METTERIVEAYVRYVKGWATIPNLGCAGQNEIDLFAIDPLTNERWHIEVSVSVSSGFSALTDETFKEGHEPHRATARRKLGYFIAKKFQPAGVLQRLAALGCIPGEVHRAIVTWGWKAGVEETAAAACIELWSLPAMMDEIAQKTRKEGARYLADDVLRTIDLYSRARS
nr:hypothetical protein [uncultured Sphingomonas sp.]